MRFAYYIPQLAHNDATEEKLVELGLGDRFRDCFGRLSHLHIARTQIIARGPDDGAGAWIYAKDDNKDALPWKPDGSWESQLSDNVLFYLCWQKGPQHEPELLKRRKIVEGCDVEMLDGKAWHCPTIRKAFAVPNLQCVYERKNGDVFRNVVPSQAELWRKSGVWAAEYFGSGLDEAKLVDIATTCLSLNYRVGDEELRILGVLGYDGMRRALEVAIDLDFVRESAEGGQKKSDPSDGSIDEEN